MKKKLQIFIKYPFYKIGIEYVILIVLGLALLLSSGKSAEPLATVNTLSGIIFFPYIIIVILSNAFRVERLGGKLRGDLIFEKTKSILAIKLTILSKSAKSKY